MREREGKRKCSPVRRSRRLRRDEAKERKDKEEEETAVAGRRRRSPRFRGEEEESECDEVSDGDEDAEEESSESDETWKGDNEIDDASAAADVPDAATPAPKKKRARVVRQSPHKSYTPWLDRLAELKKFREEYGHCNVSQKFLPNTQLGWWVGTQRVKYGKGALKPDRIGALEGLGFAWKIGRAGSHSKRWDEMYGRLLAFHEKFGHSDVPHRYKKDKSLGVWVSNQRQMYRKVRRGKKDESDVLKSRRKKLEEVNFQYVLGTGADVPIERTVKATVRSNRKQVHRVDTSPHGTKFRSLRVALPFLDSAREPSGGSSLGTARREAAAKGRWQRTGGSDGAKAKATAPLSGDGYGENDDDNGNEGGGTEGPQKTADNEGATMTKGPKMASVDDAAPLGSDGASSSASHPDASDATRADGGGGARVKMPNLSEGGPSQTTTRVEATVCRGDRSERSPLSEGEEDRASASRDAAASRKDGDGGSGSDGTRPGHAGAGEDGPTRAADTDTGVDERGAAQSEPSLPKGGKEDRAGASDASATSRVDAEDDTTVSRDEDNPGSEEAKPGPAIIAGAAVNAEGNGPTRAADAVDDRGADASKPSSSPGGEEDRADAAAAATSRVIDDDAAKDGVPATDAASCISAAAASDDIVNEGPAGTSAKGHVNDVPTERKRPAPDSPTGDATRDDRGAQLELSSPMGGEEDQADASDATASLVDDEDDVVAIRGGAGAGSNEAKPGPDAVIVAREAVVAEKDRPTWATNAVEDRGTTTSKPSSPPEGVKDRGDAAAAMNRVNDDTVKVGAPALSVLAIPASDDVVDEGPTGAGSKDIGADVMMERKRHEELSDGDEDTEEESEYDEEISDKINFTWDVTEVERRAGAERTRRTPHPPSSSPRHRWSAPRSKSATMGGTPLASSRDLFDYGLDRQSDVGTSSSTTRRRRKAAATTTREGEGAAADRFEDAGGIEGRSTDAAAGSTTPATATTADASEATRASNEVGSDVGASPRPRHDGGDLTLEDLAAAFDVEGGAVAASSSDDPTGEARRSTPAAATTPTNKPKARSARSSSSTKGRKRRIDATGGGRPLEWEAFVVPAAEQDGRMVGASETTATATMPWASEPTARSTRLSSSPSSSSTSSSRGRKRRIGAGMGGGLLPAADQLCSLAARTTSSAMGRGAVAGLDASSFRDRDASSSTATGAVNNSVWTEGGAKRPLSAASSSTATAAPMLPEGRTVKATARSNRKQVDRVDAAPDGTEFRSLKAALRFLDGAKETPSGSPSSGAAREAASRATAKGQRRGTGRGDNANAKTPTASSSRVRNGENEDDGGGRRVSPQKTTDDCVNAQTIDDGVAASLGSGGASSPSSSSSAAHPRATNEVENRGTTTSIPSSPPEGVKDQGDAATAMSRVNDDTVKVGAPALSVLAIPASDDVVDEGPTGAGSKEIGADVMMEQICPTPESPTGDMTGDARGFDGTEELSESMSPAAAIAIEMAELRAANGAGGDETTSFTMMTPAKCGGCTAELRSRRSSSRRRTKPKKFWLTGQEGTGEGNEVGNAGSDGRNGSPAPHARGKNQSKVRMYPDNKDVRRTERDALGAMTTSVMTTKKKRKRGASVIPRSLKPKKKAKSSLTLPLSSTASSRSSSASRRSSASGSTLSRGSSSGASTWKDSGEETSQSARDRREQNRFHENIRIEDRAPLGADTQANPRSSVRTEDPPSNAAGAAVSRSLVSDSRGPEAVGVDAGGGHDGANADGLDGPDGGNTDTAGTGARAGARAGVARGWERARGTMGSSVFRYMNEARDRHAASVASAMSRGLAGMLVMRFMGEIEQTFRHYSEQLQEAEADGNERNVRFYTRMLDLIDLKIEQQDFFFGNDPEF